MAGLVLEGGTLRPIFSCGVLDALLDYDVMFPYCIGVSAGVSDAISYVSRQKGRNLDIAMKYRNDKRYIGVGNLRKNKSIFGMDFIFDTLPNGELELDYETYYAYEGALKVGVTNCLTGKSEYMNGLEKDDKFQAFRATCAIPVMFPPIYINGVPYYDGGLGDPIPIRKAIEDGNEKNLIILTQTSDYIKELDRQSKFVAKRMMKKFPNLHPVLMSRYEKYNEIREYCAKLEKEGNAIVLYPEYKLNSFEKDINTLKKSYDMGYRIARERMKEIKELLD